MIERHKCTVGFSVAFLAVSLVTAPPAFSKAATFAVMNGARCRDAAGKVETPESIVAHDVFAEKTASNLVRLTSKINDRDCYLFWFEVRSETLDNEAALSASEKAALENVFWESAQRSESRADYEAYLAAFPAGLYAPLARNRLASRPAVPPQRTAYRPPHRSRRKRLMRKSGSVESGNSRVGGLSRGPAKSVPTRVTRLSERRSSPVWPSDFPAKGAAERGECRRRRAEPSDLNSAQAFKALCHRFQKRERRRPMFSRVRREIPGRRTELRLSFPGRRRRARTKKNSQILY